MNKMCFKITLSMMCCFFFPLFPSNFSCSNQTSEVFAWHSVVFLLFYLSDHQSCINRTCVKIFFVFVINFFLGGVQDMACLSLVYPQAVK